MIALLRVFGFALLAALVSSMGYGVLTWQFWAVLLLTFGIAISVVLD